MRLAGSKLTAVDSREETEVKQEADEMPALAPATPRSNNIRPRSEVLRSYDGMEAEIAADLRNLGLDQKDEVQDDDNVFPEPVMLSNPTAEIRDGGSPDPTSPERGTPAQQFETFSGVVAAATAEVANQAQTALANIARNLREVDGRSLRCLEREISLKRREADLQEREAAIQRREAEARAAPRDIPVSWSASHLSFGKRGQTPHIERRESRRPYPGLRMPLGVTPLVNKKGKRSLCFVDDMSMPIDEAGFIRKVIPSNMPRIDLGGKPGNAWRTPMRKNFPLLTQDQRWKEARAMYNHGEELDDLEAWGFKRDDAPVGRGPGGKKRGRNWKNGKGRKRFRGAETCRPMREERMEDKDDEEGPPEPRTSNHGQRERCHSNVFIRQNVNVK